MLIETDDLVAVGTVARMLGLSRLAVPGLVEAGELRPVVEIDGVSFFDRRACQSYRRMRAGSLPPPRARASLADLF